MLTRFRNTFLKTQIRNHKKKNEQQIYHSDPEFTFIVQFFNKRNNIKPILSRLKQFEGQEIIILDDGSIDGSYAEWPKYLSGKNHFLLRSNDLYEIRTYDRAIRMAKGKYLCLLQDDDIPPTNHDWVHQARALFERYPKLLVLSGKQGVNISSKNPYLDNSSKTEPIFHPTLLEPSTQIPFMFTMTAYRAPLFLRAKEFLDIGGLDLSYSPFMCDDAEVSLRAWTKGFSVGFYHVDCQRDVGTGGTRLYNTRLLKTQDQKNQERLYQTYGHLLSEGSIQKQVTLENRKLNKAYYP